MQIANERLHESGESGFRFPPSPLSANQSALLTCEAGVGCSTDRNAFWPGKHVAASHRDVWTVCRDFTPVESVVAESDESRGRNCLLWSV